MPSFGHSSTAVSTAAVQVLGVADNRGVVFIYNNGTGPTMFGASNVSSSNGFPVVASGALTLYPPESNTDLFAIAAAARTINILSKGA